MDLPTRWRRQDGVARHGQLLEHLSRWAIPRMVTAGELVRVHPRVYRLAACPDTPRSRLRAAVLWAPETAVVVGAAAAWWWGLPYADPAPVVQLAVPPETSARRPPPGIRLIRTRLDPRDVGILDDLRLTHLAVTVLDVAVELGAAADSGGKGRKLLDRALQTVVTLEDLRDAHERRPRRRGFAAAEALLAQAGDRTASEPERRVVALLRAAGVSGFVVNLEVRLSSGRFVLDFAFPEYR